jgi:hypothetical protein
MGMVLGGWMLAGEGQPEEGITLIREGLDAYTPTGSTRRGTSPSLTYQPYCLALLARVCLNAGLHDDGRAALLEAFELTERIGQRFLDADLHLLMGELILAAGGDRGEAESHYSAALEVARRQGATPLARRAAESLERLHAVSG